MKKLLDKLLSILLVLVIILFIGELTINFACEKVVVDGNSMEPTIVDQSEGYMFKVTENTTINRFDVVASTYGDAEDFYIIKRVLGLPGEEVRLEDNVLYIDGEVVEQTFSFNPRTTNFTYTKWLLDSDEYLIVGDNRAVTINPAVVTKDDIFAINGFSYKNPEKIGIYLFKDGI